MKVLFISGRPHERGCAYAAIAEAAAVPEKEGVQPPCYETRAKMHFIHGEDI